MTLAAAAVAEQAASAAPRARARGFEPYGRPVTEISAALATGRTTATALVRHYLARIAAFNRTGPRINAVTYLHPQVYAEAARSDARRRTGRPRGPLDGIPFVVKDNIDVAGLPTTAGSIALLRNVRRTDAAAVTRLRAAGAIVLGKTNMSELATSHGRLGYSSTVGLTLNPLDLRRNASGSSSGAAAAVAADFAPMALATDTSGSIRCPASSVGIVGLRPTLDDLSTAGIVPSSSHLDVVGPLTRTTADAALVLTALGTASPQAPPSNAQGMRVGVVTGLCATHDDVTTTLADVAVRLGGLGMTPVPLTLTADAAAPLVAAYGEQDFVHDVDDYLRTCGRPTPRTVQQIISILGSPWAARLPNPPNPARIEALHRAAATAGLRDLPVHQAWLAQARTTLQDAVRAVLAEHRLDALAFATMAHPVSPRYDHSDPSYVCVGDAYAPAYLSPATGFPEVTVPAGLDRDGLPIGVSFLSDVHAESTLLQIAGALQTAAAIRPTTPCTPALS